MNETCQDCGKPIHWYEHSDPDKCGWYHNELIDAFSCSGTGMIEPAAAEA